MVLLDSLLPHSLSSIIRVRLIRKFTAQTQLISGWSVSAIGHKPFRFLNWFVSVL